MYTLPDSALAAALIRKLEEQGINNYEVTSPTIEEIFFNVAEDTELSHISPNLPPDNSLPFERMSDDILETERKAISAEDAGKPLELETGRRIGVIRQALTLFRKRFTVFQRNWFPYIAAFLIPGKSSDMLQNLGSS